MTDEGEFAPTFRDEPKNADSMYAVPMEIAARLRIGRRDAIHGVRGGIPGLHGEV